MSHFTVLVIGENQEEQLAPFQENNMGDCPKEFMVFEEDEDYDVDEETGKKGHWHNPNSKWDWYVLGGRWTGFFKLKTGVEAVVGRPGVLTAPAEEGYGDQVMKSEIDFDAMRDEAGKKAQDKYEEAMSIFGHLPVNRSWSDVRESFGEKIHEARDFYWGQERCKALRESDGPLKFGDPDEFLTSKEDYIENARAGAIATFAVIKDGKWYERGSMGWWGVVSDEKEESEWNKQFSELIDGLPDSALLSIYDCHI